MKKKIFVFVLLLISLAFSQYSTYLVQRQSPNSDLFKAIVSGDVENVRKAIEKGADVDAKCKIRGYTNECFWPNYESECSDMDQWCGFEEVGGHAVKKKEEFFTALFLAAKFKRPEIVQMLLDRGANANLTSNVYRIECEGECFPRLQEVSSFREVFYAGESSDDANLRTAMVFIRNGFFEELYRINDLITNKNISDEVLAEYLDMMSRNKAISPELLQQLEEVNGKVVTLLDLAVAEHRFATAHILSDIGVRSVYYSAIVGECREEDNFCGGSIWDVRFSDGTEERVELCQWCGT